MPNTKRKAADLEWRDPGPRPGYRPAGAMGSGARKPLAGSRSPQAHFRLNLANLLSDMDDDELKDTAGAYGKVLGFRLMEGGPQGSKWGWVEFATMREAERALAALADRPMAEWHLLLRAELQGYYSRADRQGSELT